MADLFVRDVSVRHREHPVLEHVSLTAGPGEVLVVLGGPRSGKTTLLRTIAGLSSPDDGVIRFGETPWFDAGREIDIEAAERRLAFVFRSYALWPHRTVFDNVAYGLRQRRLPDSEAAARSALTDLGIADLAGRRPPDLTTAQQLRVALARALAAAPTMALLDQPLDNLEPLAAREHRGWLRALLASRFPSALVSSADPMEAMALGDRIALLHDGRIEQEGTPEELYNRPRTEFVATFFGDCNRIEGTVIEASAEDAVLDFRGIRLVGRRCGEVAVGGRATGLIRPARVLLGGGPGPSRVPANLTAQLCLGDRWELVFEHDGVMLRALANSPLRHTKYHLEFPSDALLVF